MRQRLLLLTAIELYEKNAKAAIGTLENLNLSTAQVESVQSRCGIAKDAIEKQAAGKAITFQQPVAVTLRDCLALYYKQTEGLIDKAEKLRSGTSEPEELQQELKALHLQLGDSTTRPLDFKPADAQPELPMEEPAASDNGQGDLIDQTADSGGVDGKGTPPPKAEKVRPLTGIPD